MHSRVVEKWRSVVRVNSEGAGRQQAQVFPTRRQRRGPQTMARDSVGYQLPGGRDLTVASP